MSMNLSIVLVAFAAFHLFAHRRLLKRIDELEHKMSYLNDKYHFNIPTKEMAVLEKQAKLESFVEECKEKST